MVTGWAVVCGLSSAKGSELPQRRPRLRQEHNTNTTSGVYQRVEREKMLRAVDERHRLHGCYSVMAAAPRCGACGVVTQAGGDDTPRGGHVRSLCGIIGGLDEFKEVVVHS